MEKQDQISGCRDRAESIKPERIHDALIKVLMEKEPQHLEKAVAQKEWTCLVWVDKSIGIQSQGDSAVSGDENDASSVLKRRKRQLAKDEHSGEEQNKRLSIMEKTERVESFSFSFL